jgi:hypothetical protein
MSRDLLFEELAAIEHGRWSDWQLHLHSKCVKAPGGDLLIPADYVYALEKLARTPYANLSEEQKENDRNEVRRYWRLIEPRIEEARDRIVRFLEQRDLPGHLENAIGYTYEDEADDLLRAIRSGDE